MPTIAEQLLMTTVKVVTKSESSPTASGTAFFYVTSRGDHQATFLVTNKHVLAGSNRVEFVCHLESGRTESCSLDFLDRDLICHPDADVDLCALNIVGLQNALKTKGEDHKFVAIFASDIPTAEEWDNFDAIEEVTMVGCPRGIYDDFNKSPIVRRGVTSTSPSKRYNGRPEFMVDMACFPGSSGSPIFLYNGTGYFDKKANAYLMGSSRIKLLEVLYSGPLITNDGQIILMENPQVSVSTMMHLGYAVRSSEILVLEDIFWQRATPRTSIASIDYT